MKRHHTNTIIALLLVAFTPRVGAQVVDKGYQPKMLVYENLHNDSVLRHFRERFRIMDELVNTPGSVPPQLSEGLLTHNFTRPELPNDSLYSAKTESETMAMRKRNGLEITGQVYGRLDSAVDGLLNSDDDEAQSVYKAKVQGEIGWNWINSSFYQRKEKERSILLGNKIDQARKAADGTEFIDAWTDTLTQRWNHVIAAVMLCHVRNLDVLNEAYQFMIENDRTTSEKLLDVMNDKMELEFELSQIFAKDEMPTEERLFLMIPQDITIDTLALRSAIALGNPHNKLTALQMAKIDNDMRLTNYLSTMRLTPFARWSTYLDSHSHFSHNIDVGVRFTIPLYNDTKPKRRAMAIEKDLLRTEYATYTDEVMARCQPTIDRVRRLNKSIAVEYGHLKQLRKFLIMRQEVYQKNQGRYSYIDRLLECNEYCKSMERIYKQMRDRSLALVTIQKIALLPTLDNILKTQELK